MVIRAWIRHATAVRALLADGRAIALARLRNEGLFEGVVPGATAPQPYQLAVTLEGGGERIRRDPYSFWPQLSDYDLDLFKIGHHHHLGAVLGAHAMTVDGAAGVRFAVWAPRARSVSVIGDWNGFDGTAHPMRLREPHGVWELFLPEVRPGMLYKYEVHGADGSLRAKADPCASQAEVPPATASVVGSPEPFRWADQAWMEARASRDHLAGPMAIYEVHLGSWRRSPLRRAGGEPDAWPNYRLLAQQLVRHCRELGFTHLELLPIANHPYEGSWGYQVSGQYAPNARHGAPDDLRWFVDHCHQNGIGVIVDFVPGHFPRDDFALRAFDGSPC